MTSARASDVHIGDVQNCFAVEGIGEIWPIQGEGLNEIFGVDIEFQCVIP